MSMDLVTGAMGNLAPKLLLLLQDEYKLQKGIKVQVESLAQELKSMHAALCKVAQVPHDELDPQVNLWASEVREASYDMEDVLDTFLVRVDSGNQTPDGDKAKVNRFLEKTSKLFSSLSKIKARHEIANAIEDITKRVEEMTMRRDRYKVDDRVANNSITATSIDPRLLSLHTKALELVGIVEPRDALIKKLSPGNDDALDKNMKVVSIFGSGGLGKTTLAKVVYDNLAINMDIHCKAFVPVGQNPILKKVFSDILLELNKEYYMNKTNFMMLDERQLIDEIHDFLKEKRYIIVIDDIWEVSLWKAIRTALEDNNLGSKIIITTRCNDVAHDNQVHCSYELKPLCRESSEKLFYGRIFGSKEKCPERFSELSQTFLKKCGGVPLAIITLSSLLADKLEDITEWEVLCNAIGSGLSNSDVGVRNMRKILSLSYYDLPSHLKTCFLYLSMYPEDYEITRDQLIWMWIAEGFIQPQQYRDDLFELGETYFNELINRSLVQPVGRLDSSRGIYGCRVHDMIFDLIRSFSREENFVTTSDDIEQVISSKTKQIHRLSVNNTTCPKSSMSRVRSIALFYPSIDSIPFLSSFVVLRVLALEGCYLGGIRGMKLNVGNLIHLRYLGLQGTRLRELPEGIEKLQHLQVFNMDVRLGPSLQSIFWLRQLMCLERFPCCPRPGNLLRNLASLQVLWYLHLDEGSASAVEELSHLTKLTTLRIDIHMQMGQSICDALISSLGKLRRLQELTIHNFCWRQKNRLIKWKNWMPPPHLRTLMLENDLSLQTLPKWISPTSLPHLTDLHLDEVNIVRPEDIQILGELPSLFNLYMLAGSGNLEGPLQKFVLSADAFPRATCCKFFRVVTVPSMFPQGAMPRVEELWFCLRARDFFSNDGLDFSDLTMEQFPSLQMATFNIQGSTDGEDEEVKEALKHAADVHPNHPSIEFW